VKCFDCKSSELITGTIANYRYNECGLPNITLKSITQKRCPNCGSTFVSIPGMKGLHRSIATALISKSSKLTSAEIRFLRKSLGWSASDFARKFHTSAPVVSRWESERMSVSMSTANELLLRVLVAQGQKIENYQEHMEKLVLERKIEPVQLILNHTGKKWEEAA